MSIREGIKDELQTMNFIGAEMALDYDELTTRIVNRLKSQGIVQKVEGELTILIPDGKRIAKLVKQAGYTQWKELE
ncbi:hypothetical protein LCGC14_2899300 [marine sediment metagenome]|uniref:Uncharacterized protein n=1 Tax=marine sediment metagenome TaxID=412755 RepID=A0A0F9A2T0_9ZZZZ